MIIKGRLPQRAASNPKFQGQVYINEGGVTIRIDDPNNLEFWLEIDLDELELQGARIIREFKGDGS